MQYCERSRLEYHTEAAPPYDIQLGQFGRHFHPGGTPTHPEPPAPPIPGATYFAASGHNLAGRFRDYWQANGGLAQFGYPLTEEGREVLEDGQRYTVQYFERARLEDHPEIADPDQRIQLGQFGRRVLADAERLAGPFARFYAADPALQAQLGAPTARAVTVSGAALAFGRGAMLYRADTRQILVFCPSERGSERGQWTSFPDTWTAGQPDGPGPHRGFGKVWREQQAVRDCLGDARSPDETALDLVIQPFERGEIYAAADARARAVAYGLYGHLVIYADGRYETYTR